MASPANFRFWRGTHYVKRYDNFYGGMSTKYPQNTIGDNQFGVLLNCEVQEKALTHRHAVQRHLGPPGLVRLLHSHTDNQNRKFLCASGLRASDSSGEIWFTQNPETATSADWQEMNNGGADLGLNSNYLPWATSFQGSVYFVNGFNGCVKFTGTSAITVPPIPPCSIVAAGPRRLIAIALVGEPSAIRFSALDDGDRFSGREGRSDHYQLTDESQLPFVEYYRFVIGAGDGDGIIGYYYYRKTHVFFKNRSVWIAYGGLDPTGTCLPDERFRFYPLTRTIGCLSGRCVAEDSNGNLLWRGYDGQIYSWNGAVDGPAGTEQYGITIKKETDPDDPRMASIGDLMDYNNGGFKKPQYGLAAIGAATQAEWVAGTTKTNVDTTTTPGTLLASRDVTSYAKKEYYEPSGNLVWDNIYTRNSYPPPGFVPILMGNRFKCTSAARKIRASFKFKIISGLSCQFRAQLLLCTDGQIPDKTALKAEGWAWATGTGAEQTVNFELTGVEALVLNSVYFIGVECIQPGPLGWENHYIQLQYQSPGADPESTNGQFVYGRHSNGYETWHSSIGADMWYQLYEGATVYQASSAWHHYYDKGDETSNWGIFLVNALVRPNTTLTYYAKCAATAAEVDTAAEITAAITNGTSLDSATYGGNVPANRFVGLRIVATTTTPFDQTWEVYNIKASFVQGSVASSLSQACIYQGDLYMTAMENTLLTPYNPSGTAATVNNVILKREDYFAFSILRGIKHPTNYTWPTNQTDFGFNSLVNHDGAMYGALATAITGVITAITDAPHAGGTGYTAGDILSIVQSGASGGRCTVSTVDANGVVTALTTTPTSEGCGYVTGSPDILATTGGTGSGCTVHITASTATYRLGKFDVDQAYDLVNDLNHKLWTWVRWKNDDYGMTHMPKKWHKSRITTEGTSDGTQTGQAIQFTHSLDEGIYYPVGYDHGLLDSLTTGAIKTVSTAPVAGGTGYTIGDKLTVVQAFGTAQIVVTSVNATTGAVESLSLYDAGAGPYTIGTKDTTGGTGTDCTVNITAVVTAGDLRLIYPYLYALGQVNSRWKSDSNTWPMDWTTDPNNIPMRVTDITYPNNVDVEYSADRTSRNAMSIGYRNRPELLTTNKFRLHYFEEVWEPLSDGIADGTPGGISVETPTPS